ncbi:MAG: B12-binding domain-containing protein [Acidimicrobiia bacterium]|nr:B12-binding domain-containing protein [Acidimicrobiia bacterium]
MNESQPISLQAAADLLGVHYMTAYRYIRLGKLPAYKDGNTWRVELADIESLMSPPTAAATQDWPARLEDRLLDGDEPGAWSIIEAALTSGGQPRDIYERGLLPALRSIGERWEGGRIDIADEHRASLIATRLVGRISPRFTPRGRRRGSIILGSPPGDAHHLGGTMLADLLRLDHFNVDDLGANTPAESFVHAVKQTSDLVAVGISAFAPENEEAIERTVGMIKTASSVPVFLGGGAIQDAAHAEKLGADGFAASTDEVVELFRSALGDRA